MRMRPQLVAAAVLILVLGSLNLFAEHVLHGGSQQLRRFGQQDQPQPVQQAATEPPRRVLSSGEVYRPRKVSKYHTVVTCDKSVYNQWQVRVNYYHWSKLKAREPSDSAVGGYTRLLHSGKADGLMTEIPTVVVDPLPRNVPDGGYVVLHRPYGFLQWVQRGYVARLEEDFIFMSEPDHLFLILPPMIATPDVAAAYPFYYVNIQKHRGIINNPAFNFNPKKVSVDTMQPIGNSPVMMAKDKLEQIFPIWYDLSVRFKRNNDTEAAFGWILEMYAFSVAASQIDSGPVKFRLMEELMLQPPWDEAFTLHGHRANILHYTYGQDCDEETGKPLRNKRGSWHFDKRDYENKYPPRSIPPPRHCRGETLGAVTNMINEASAVLEPWSYQAAPKA